MVSFWQSLVTIGLVFALWTILGVFRMVHEYISTGAVRNPATGEVIVGQPGDE